MQAKNRKILIVASSIVLVGGIIGGTIGAAFALTSSANDEVSQMASPADDFYATGQSIYTGDTGGTVSSWVAPENPAQELFYIATGEQDSQAWPFNILMVNPSQDPLGGNGGGTHITHTVHWEQIGVAGHRFVTQQSYAGLSQNDQYEDPYYTSGFTFKNFWKDSPHSSIPITYLAPAAYDRVTQTYDYAGNIEQAAIWWTWPEPQSTGFLSSQPVEKLETSVADNYRVTSVEPTDDVAIWGTPNHPPITYTHSRIGFNEDGYMSTNGAVNPESIYIDTSADKVIDNTPAQTTTDKSRSGDLFLFPILTVKQDVENSVNGVMELYLTFGGFQTKPDNQVMYRVEEYGTKTEVKAWTPIGTFQSMDNYHLSISGLTDGKTYNIQFSSDFAYKTWAEYKFTVGDAPDTYWSEYDFYNQFPDAKPGNTTYGNFYLIDPNTGLAINYEKPSSTVNTESNHWVWGNNTGNNVSLDGTKANGGRAPVLRIDDWYNDENGKILQVALMSSNDVRGSQFAFYEAVSGVGYVSQKVHTAEDHTNLDSYSYDVNNDNVAKFGITDNIQQVPNWDQYWGYQIYSNNETVGGKPTFNWNSGDKSKPTGTPNDGFILIPYLNIKQPEMTSNSFTFNLKGSAFQDTTYNIYYTVAQGSQSASEKIYLDSFSSVLDKTYTINNLISGYNYTITLYVSNAANSVLFPEVANKYYEIFTVNFVTPAVPDVDAEFSLSSGNEATQEKDINGDGDETDPYVNMTTTSTNPYDAVLMASTFVMNIYDSNNQLVDKWTLSEWDFNGKNTNRNYVLTTESSQLPNGEYTIELVQTKSNSEKTYTYEDMTISNNYALGEISSVSDEATLGQDLNADSDMTDMAIQFTTSTINEYISNFDSTFVIDIYDETNQALIASNIEVSKTIFEGEGVTSWFAVDGVSLPQSLLTITITQNTTASNDVVIETLSFDNT